ncbi:DUF261 family protein [Borreliella burgdorferi]|uniref:Uncharacterized protein n=1 Tax=Borreliella burgdorferi (strain ZS7) TaxID=445985 RepID=A0A0H3C297_BORBZ|nr:DUF261 family protein [Borreliella burgdorferi]ACK75336.1 conserved hypothetical protein [Borreliella burgdorferi ZS7]
MNNKMFLCIYNFFYKLLKDYFIKKYKSELLESAACFKNSYKETVKEVEIHRIAVPLQIQFKEQNEVISKFGCYFLCILFIGLVVKEIKNSVEKCFDCFEIDLLFKGLVSKGCLRGDNAFVNSPNAIFANLGIDEDIFFEEKHHPTSYIPSESDILIGKYKDTSSNFYHFVILNSDLKTVIWDSLGNSKTVSNGHLESLRAFKIQNKAILERVKDRLEFYSAKFRNNLEVA